MKAKAKKTKVVQPIVSCDGAVMLIYRPVKDGNMPKGWYLREYHSTPTMDAHLKHLLEETPPPAKGMGSATYCEEGPFTWQEILEEAFHRAYVPWEHVPDMIKERAS